MILNAKSRYHLNDTVPDSSSSPITCPVSNSEVELDAIASRKSRYKSVTKIVGWTSNKIGLISMFFCSLYSLALKWIFINREIMIPDTISKFLWKKINISTYVQSNHLTVHFLRNLKVYYYYDYLAGNFR